MTVFWDRGKSDVDADIQTAKRHGFEWLVLYHKEVTPDKVRKLHSAGFKVGVWTVNDVELMKRFLDMGIDRIYTDNPRALNGLLSSRARHVK